MLHDNLQRSLRCSLDIMQQDRYEEAASLLDRALTIGEAVLESDHPDIALILHTQACLFSFKVEYVCQEIFLFSESVHRGSCMIGCCGIQIWGFF